MTHCKVWREVGFACSYSDRNLVELALAGTLAMCFMAYAIRWGYFIFTNLGAGDIWNNDFFTLWSSAKFAAAHPVSAIYDRQALQDFQMDLGEYPNRALAFAHPPSFVFLTMPLGFTSYYVAYAAWSLGTFLCYFLASRCRRIRSAAVFLSIFAPATIITLAFGQTGFLTAALILGGFRLAGNRPVLSGIFFGLASIKPQLGMLIPIALISARRWRTFAAAAGDSLRSHIGEQRRVRLVHLAVVVLEACAPRGLGCGGKHSLQSDNYRQFSFSRGRSLGNANCPVVCRRRRHRHNMDLFPPRRVVHCYRSAIGRYLSRHALCVCL